MHDEFDNEEFVELVEYRERLRKEPRAALVWFYGRRRGRR